MNKSKLSKFLIFLLLFAFFMPTNFKFNHCNAAELNELNITSKSALLVDYDSGTVVFEKNSNARLPIASMTKLASLSIIFDYLDKGIIKESDLVCVSEHASKVGGSSAFLDAGSKYKVTDLIKTIIIASANDSTVAMAEYVAGSEESFVSKMNKFANSLSLENTNFVNASGLPAENHYSSARDMVKIYKSMCNNALYKKYSKLWMDDFIHPSGRKTGLVNTNRLIRTFDGIDGGKTGFTNSARFCLTASATRGDTRLIGVIIGADDSKTRFAEMSKMLNYGFANYETKNIVDKDVPITIAKFKNAKNNVTAYPENSLNKFMKKTDNFSVTTDYEIYELKAPVKKGDKIGKLFLFDENNMVIDEVALIAGEDSGEIGFSESFDKIIKLW